MIAASFHTRVPGKWVLAGEHAVLRGARAVALPHPSFCLDFTYQPQLWEELRVSPASAQALLLAMLAELKVAPRGTLQLESTIPTGAGLGSSAALCVALTRWLSGPLRIPAGEETAFARKLEDRFHGRSSGMDVAVVSGERPIRYSMEKGAEPLVMGIPPSSFRFHDTGLRASTRECIERVDAFRRAEPGRAEAVDARMGEACDEAAAGLAAGDRARVAQAMRAAQSCFEDWGLVPPQARAVVDRELARGALAAKLTGAGGGGFVVTLERDQ